MKTNVCTYNGFSEGMMTPKTEILIRNRSLEGIPIKFSLRFTNFIIRSHCVYFLWTKLPQIEWTKTLCLFTYSSLHFTLYIVHLTIGYVKIVKKWFQIKSPFTVHHSPFITLINNRNKIAPWFSLLDMDVYFLFRVSPCHKFFPEDSINTHISIYVCR